MTNQMAPPTGAEIRAARTARDLSIRKLAQLAGVQWRTLRDWEDGRRVPRYDTIKAVVEALNKTPPLPRLDSGTPGATPPTV